MSQEKTVVAEIPVLVSRPSGAGPAPLVLLSHGFTGCKENWTEQLDELAGKGCLAVAMDNRLHGERAGAGFASLMQSGKLDLLNLRRVMAKTAADISALIDCFSGDSTVDSGRIAVAGVSMGGFVSFAALVNDPRIKVAVPIIASPYWSDIPGDTPVELGNEAQADLADYAGKNEPANRKQAIPPRALLMQIGAEDTHYDRARVERFYEELRMLYGDSAERVRLIVHPRIAHEFTAEMWANAVAWLETYL
ncbi:MAG: alpha/beta fold hydrolase [Gaiellaceae bacterium]|jgi:dienelactone hydrolase